MAANGGQPYRRGAAADRAAADLHWDPCFDAPFGLATALHLAKTPFCNNALGHGLDDRVPAAAAAAASQPAPLKIGSVYRQYCD